MSRKSSPATVRKAVHVAVYWPVYVAVGAAAHLAVSGAEDVPNRPQHPNLHMFLIEVRQARRDAP